MGASNWLAGALAAAGVVGAVVCLVLKALYERAKRAETAAALWARPPLRAGDVTAELYDLAIKLGRLNPQTQEFSIDSRRKKDRDR